MNTLSISDLNTSIDAEPRILDVTLGERLGMAQPLNLRTKIKQNISEMSLYGGVITETVKTSRHGGRPSKAYYLNEPQAILLCMFANTPTAADVRHQVITVFMAYRRGGVQVKAHERRTSTPIEQAVRLRTNIERLERAVASLTAPHSAALVTVNEMLRRIEADEAAHSADFAMRLGAIRKVIGEETVQRQATIDGVYTSKRQRYAETIPTLLGQGQTPREVALKTGANLKTVYRYRAVA